MTELAAKLRRWWAIRWFPGTTGPARVPAPPGFAGWPARHLGWTVWRRFALMVGRHRDRPAVKAGAITLTYAQLERRASTLAHELAFHRLDPAAPVALLVLPNEKMIAAILAVAKTGRPFVFLDRSLPTERLKFMVRQCGASACVYHPSLAGRLDAILPAEVKRISLSDSHAPAEPGAPRRANADAPLCLNYTSGTTGTPSGVVRTHAAVMLNIRNMTALAKLSPSDRLTLCISPSAGAALMDIFGALLNGACVLPFDVRRHGVERLVTWMAEEKVTVFHAVPTLFRAVTQSLDGPGSLPDVRFVLLGGEPVFRSDLEAFQVHFSPPAVLQNVLAMTEGAGILCSYLADHSTRLEGERMPVGYPVPGKRVWVAATDGRPAPPGEEGEIVVESAWLANGYHGESERTADRWKKVNGSRVHLFTGDRGCLRLRDGALEWIARMDTQLKIGGHRVSPVEVEAVILRHAGVRLAVVTPARRADGRHHGRETQLMAWIVPSRGSSVDTLTLRTMLRTVLPVEAVPTRWVVVAELPLLPNGKIDRSSLTLDHPAAAAREHAALDVPARGPVERFIAGLWAEELRTGPVGAYDHFFELGGDSLAAVNVLARLSSHYGFELPATALIRHATVAELAEMIPLWRSKAEQRGTFAEPATRIDHAPVVPLRNGSAEPVLIIVPGGQGTEQELLVFGRVLAALGGQEPVFGFRLSAYTGALPSVSDLSALAAQLVRDLAGVLRPGQQWMLLGECGGGLLAAEMARLIAEHRPLEPPAAVILFDTRTNGHLALHGIGTDHLWIGLPEPMRPYFDLLLRWQARAVNCPLHVIASEAVLAGTDDESLGWASHASAGVATARIPGDHLGYIREHPDHVAAALRSVITSVLKTEALAQENPVA